MEIHDRNTRIQTQIFTSCLFPVRYNLDIFKARVNRFLLDKFVLNVKKNK